MSRLKPVQTLKDPEERPTEGPTVHDAPARPRPSVPGPTRILLQSQLAYPSGRIAVSQAVCQLD
jgi:hypothetical protein